MQCPKCRSERFVKNGIVKSKQRCGGIRWIVPNKAKYWD